MNLMTSPFRLVLAGTIATAAALLVGCNKRDTDDVAGAPMPPANTTSTTGDDIDDSVVTGRVKTALLAAPDVQSLDIGVTTVKGEVTLSGVVETQAQIDTAARVARDTAGTRSVRNDLKLKP